MYMYLYQWLPGVTIHHHIRHPLARPGLRSAVNLEIALGQFQSRHASTRSIVSHSTILLGQNIVLQMQLFGMRNFVKKLKYVHAENAPGSTCR